MAPLLLLRRISKDLTGSMNSGTLLLDYSIYLPGDCFYNFQHLIIHHHVLYILINFISHIRCYWIFVKCRMQTHHSHFECCKLRFNQYGTSHVACCMSNMLYCSTTYNACHIASSQVPRRTSSVERHTCHSSHVACHMSNVECRSFHVARRKLHVKRHHHTF